MDSADRPLSPHLQIYRWQLTSVLSILHRAAGVALSLGAILLVWWLVAAASGPDAYDRVAGLSRLVARARSAARLERRRCSIICATASGIWWWDTGHALDLRSTYVGGWLVVAAAAALTLVAWVAGISRWVS